MPPSNSNIFTRQSWIDRALGTAETEAILRRFTRTGPQHPTYLAFLELGRAVKTIFLCRYLESEALRREIQEGLNVIENWNGANSFIFYGRSSEFATNRLDEQELAALSLHLLQICLVYILSRDFGGHLRISQVSSSSLQRESTSCTFVLGVVPLWKVIVMAAFTLTQSEADPSIFVVVGPAGRAQALPADEKGGFPGAYAPDLSPRDAVWHLPVRFERTDAD
jgi:Tn3 transposase DDE domain